jgi:multimeric flavodoxin WrbA
MDLIYADDFDNIVIASPIYFSSLTPPLIGVVSRLQAYYCARRFLKDRFSLRKKTAALILVGGGDGSPSEAIRVAKKVFKILNAEEFEKHMVFSLNTDETPAHNDKNAIKKVLEIADSFNNGED